MSLASQLAALTNVPKPDPIYPMHYLGERRCKCCGERERIVEYKAGVRYSTISAKLHICVECINQELSQLAPCPPL